MLSHCRSVDSGAVITLAATGSVPQSDLQEMVDRLYEELVPRLQNSGLTHTLCPPTTARTTSTGCDCSKRITRQAGRTTAEKVPGLKPVLNWANVSSRT